MAARVILFDVNETLLDISALDGTFAAVFQLGTAGDGAAVRKEWFAQLVQLSMVGTITGGYVDYSQCSMAALDMLAHQRGLQLSDKQKAAIAKDGMLHLPAHPDIHEALQHLKSLGFRLAALTNNVDSTARAQLKFAGLDVYFEVIASADEVKRLKPAPEPYKMVAQKMGVGIDTVRLVAAHSWDITGAQAAGCQSAFLARRGEAPNLLVATPGIIGTSMVDVANKIAAGDSKDCKPIL